jgi:hypothetical protein
VRFAVRIFAAAVLDLSDQGDVQAVAQRLQDKEVLL